MAIDNMRDQTGSVRRDFYGYRASVTHHLQGETSKLGNQDFSNPKNPCCAGRSRAPGHPGGAALTAPSGLAAAAGGSAASGTGTRSRGSC